MADGSHGPAGGGSLGGFAFIVALIIAGPGLLRAVFSVIAALFVVAVIVRAVGFAARHGLIIGESLVGGTLLVVMLIRWPKATVRVGSVALYGFMMFRLFVGGR